LLSFLFTHNMSHMLDLGEQLRVKDIHKKWRVESIKTEEWRQGWKVLQPVAHGLIKFLSGLK